MEDIGQEFGNLPFELTQISKPARKYLKILVAGLIQYQKDVPVRDADLFFLKIDTKKGFHD
jgi:hypothetical protein